MCFLFLVRNPRRSPDGAWRGSMTSNYELWLQEIGRMEGLLENERGWNRPNKEMEKVKGNTRQKEKRSQRIDIYLFVVWNPCRGAWWGRMTQGRYVWLQETGRREVGGGRAGVCERKRLKTVKWKKRKRKKKDDFIAFCSGKSHLSEVKQL